VSVLLAAIVVAACASTSVTQRESRIGDQKLPRPDRILVYDFGASPADVPADSALAGRYDPSQQPTADQIEAGRALGAAVARDLAEKIRAMGLPAQRVTRGTTPQLDDIVIRGYFASIDEGSAAKRMTIGFGSGSSKLTTVVEGYQMTRQGLRKLGSGTVEATGSKGPGAAVPAAVAVATANPIGLIVTSAVKVGGEVTGRSTLEGRGEQTAEEIAEQLRPRFEQQGWIP
jgi:hypothetical protein